MHRIYCPHIDWPLKQAHVIDSAEVHHCIHVMRVKEGDYVHLFDGKGQSGMGRVITANKSQLVIEIDKINEPKTKKFTVILACAIPKNAKFNDIVDKATQLGVDEIVPLQTERTEVLLSGERALKKQQRYQAVALNACKQCGRAMLPVIHPVTPFEVALHLFTQDASVFIPHLSGERLAMHEALYQLDDVKTVVFFIGPEGDFSQNEVDIALKAGAQPLSLGHNVLRVDTAAIAVLSAIHLYK